VLPLNKRRAKRQAGASNDPGGVFAQMRVLKALAQFDES
jgi:hypothetical protein